MLPMRRYAMLCCAVLCCAMLCYAMLCYAMLCYDTSACDAPCIIPPPVPRRRSIISSRARGAGGFSAFGRPACQRVSVRSSAEGRGRAGARRTSGTRSGTGCCCVRTSVAPRECSATRLRPVRGAARRRRAAGRGTHWSPTTRRALGRAAPRLLEPDVGGRARGGGGGPRLGDH